MDAIPYKGVHFVPEECEVIEDILAARIKNEHEEDDIILADFDLYATDPFQTVFPTHVYFPQNSSWFFVTREKINDGSSRVNRNIRSNPDKGIWKSGYRKLIIRGRQILGYRLTIDYVNKDKKKTGWRQFEYVKAVDDNSFQRVVVVHMVYDDRLNQIERVVDPDPLQGVIGEQNHIEDVADPNPLEVGEQEDIAQPVPPLDEDPYNDLNWYFEEIGTDDDDIFLQLQLQDQNHDPLHHDDPLQGEPQVQNQILDGVDVHPDPLLGEQNLDGQPVPPLEEDPLNDLICYFDEIGEDADVSPQEHNHDPQHHDHLQGGLVVADQNLDGVDEHPLQGLLGEQNLDHDPVQGLLGVGADLPHFVNEQDADLNFEFGGLFDFAIGEDPFDNVFELGGADAGGEDNV